MFTPLWAATHLPLKGGDQAIRIGCADRDFAIEIGGTESVSTFTFMPHHPVHTHRRASARRMRSSMTEAELKFWNAVRAHRLMGLGFRCQMPIGGLIADFACPSHRFIVEVDGSGHGDARQIERDAERTLRLETLGWTILRFWNDDVLNDIDGVCLHVLAAIRDRIADNACD